MPTSAKKLRRIARSGKLTDAEAIDRGMKLSARQRRHLATLIPGTKAADQLAPTSITKALKPSKVVRVPWTFKVARRLKGIIIGARGTKGRGEVHFGN